MAGRRGKLRDVIYGRPQIQKVEAAQYNQFLTGLKHYAKIEKNRQIRIF
jgi:hypothetical protein